MEHTCRKLLTATGLFEQRDAFVVNLETAADDLALGQLRMPEISDLDAFLKEAKFFLEEKVFLPAMRGSSERTLHVVRDTRQWISKFQKIGDLLRYMDRFRPDTKQALFPFAQMKQIRFEDVYAEFIKKFGGYRWFHTTASDFQEGMTYSPFTLSIYTRTYNNRGGGIRPVGKVGAHEAVVANITLSGGKYANEWLEQGRRLKCYLKAPQKRSETHHSERHDANRSIMKYPDVPVLVFTRNSRRESAFIYHGIFRYVQVADDEGGKWFELEKTDVPLR
jgi:5-methylcytosine-specific restriction protein A